MTGSDEKQAFISHAKEDHATAQVLCERLEARGVRCWIAPRDIPPASDWAGSIVGAVRECTVLVLVLSADSNESEHVRREVSQAVEAGEPVFLLRVDGVPLSDSLGYFLSSKQFVEVDASAGDRELHMERLVQAVASHIETGRAQVPAAPAPARSRRVLYAGLGAAAVAAALGVAFWQWNGEDPSPSGGSESGGDAPAAEPWTPFTRVQSLPVGAGAFEMVAGRFRGSDALDLAIVTRDADSGSGSVEVHGLDGETTNAALADPTGVVRADVDCDGRDDLIVPCADGSAEFWQLNAGAWTRQGRQTGLAHAALTNLAAVDLDADGRVDLLSVGDDRPALRASYGDGGSDPWAFRPSSGDVPFHSGRGLATTVDLDGDRVPDTVVVEPEKGRGTVFWGTPAMITQSPCDLDLFAGSAPIATSAAATDLCTGDVDGDGLLDLVIVGGASGGVEVLAQQSNRTFERLAVVSAPEASAAALGDFDGDGALDVACGSRDPAAGITLIRGPLGADPQPVAVDLELADAPVDRLVAADLDLDGAAELAVLQSEAGVVSVLRGPGLPPAWGEFQTPREIAVQADVGYAPGDVDGDGFAELIGWYSEQGEQHFLAVTRLDREEPSELVTIGGAPTPGGLVYDVEIGDLDADGRSDVALIFQDDPEMVLIYRGTEDGVLQPAGGVDLGFHNVRLEYCLVLGDFLSAGRLDVFVPVIGLIALGSEGRYELTEGELDHAYDVGAHDLDGDGILDVYWNPVEPRDPPTAMWAPGLASGCPPRGTGKFDTPRPLPHGRPVDVDGDGRTELLGFADDTFTVRRGRYDGDAGVVFDEVETHSCPVSGLRQVAVDDFLGTGADQFLGLGEDGLVLISLAGPAPVVCVGPVAVDLTGTCLAEEGLAGANGRLAHDVDSDGRMDLLAFDDAEHKVVLLLAAPALEE